MRLNAGRVQREQSDPTIFYKFLNRRLRTENPINLLRERFHDHLKSEWFVEPLALGRMNRLEREAGSEIAPISQHDPMSTDAVVDRFVSGAKNRVVNRRGKELKIDPGSDHHRCRQNQREDGVVEI